MLAVPHPARHGDCAKEQPPRRATLSQSGWESGAKEGQRTALPPNPPYAPKYAIAARIAMNHTAAVAIK